MASHFRFVLQPAEVLSVSPEEADRFLVAALWSSAPGTVPVDHVRHWAEVLRGRGDDFASHAAACQYWLYEHPAGYLRVPSNLRNEHRAPGSKTAPREDEAGPMENGARRDSRSGTI
jgi:hypothetical protein